MNKNFKITFYKALNTGKCFVCRQNRVEEVVDKLLNGSFGGQESCEEYLWNGFVEESVFGVDGVIVGFD
jgi:hypothetical protein